MNPDAYDDPELEEAWCADRRQEVAEYLRGQSVPHGQIAEWPTWHFAPYVSIWAVESAVHSGRMGWWVFAGDGPTDYLSASEFPHPREAMAALAARWTSVAAAMERGEPHPTVAIGSPESWPTLGPLLRSRAQMLLSISEDDAAWAE